MLRSWMLGGLCAVALASASASHGGIVETRDGRTIEGDITEQGDQIIIDRHGMRFSLDRSEVRSISNSNSIQDEYKRRHDRLTGGDVRGRIELARWLLEKKQYDLARQVLSEARQFSLRNPDVIAMQQVVDRQQDLDDLQTRKRGPVQVATLDNAGLPPATAPASRPTSRPADDGPIRPLADDEINIVRQNEWNSGENMRATFKNNVRRTYAAAMNLNLPDFNRMTPAAQAWEILKNGTPEMKSSVILLQDPVAIAQYKVLERSVVSGCAVCHTVGKNNTKFSLIWPVNGNPSTYANFLILSKYSAKVGDREYHMIDRTNPTDSLLLDFATSPAGVLRGMPSHPPLDGKYRGISPAEPRYKRLQDWLTQSVNPQTPDYSMIPVGPASTAPPLAPKK